MGGEQSNERYVSRVTGKGQVTIPKEIRDRLGLERGEYVVWQPLGESVVMERATVSADDFDEIADRIAERFRRKGITREDVEDAIRWARRGS